MGPRLVCYKLNSGRLRKHWLRRKAYLEQSEQKVQSLAEQVANITQIH